MNYWKPIALCSIAAFGLTTLPKVAAAREMKGEATLVEGRGECFDDAQPHMAAALQHLRAARAELDSAEHNKGGWREDAKLKTDAAINATKKGCEFAAGK